MNLIQSSKNNYLLNLVSFWYSDDNNFNKSQILNTITLRSLIPIPYLCIYKPVNYGQESFQTQ